MKVICDKWVEDCYMYCNHYGVHEKTNHCIPAPCYKSIDISVSCISSCIPYQLFKNEIERILDI